MPWYSTRARDHIGGARGRWCPGARVRYPDRADFVVALPIQAPVLGSSVPPAAATLLEAERASVECERLAAGAKHTIDIANATQYLRQQQAVVMLFCLLLCELKLLQRF